MLRHVKLENRNSRVSGFRDQDVVTLQKILDAEFELEKESIIKHQREKREQAAKQAGLQRKRMMLERQLREEISEIEKDHRIEFWLTLVRLLVHKCTSVMQNLFSDEGKTQRVCGLNHCCACRFSRRRSARSVTPPKRKYSPLQYSFQVVFKLSASTDVCW